MIGSATPRNVEPRSHPLPSPVPSGRATANGAEFVKARFECNAAIAGHSKRQASLAGRIEVLAPTEIGLRHFLDELGRAVQPDDCNMTDAEAFAAGLPLEPKTERRLSEPHVQSLLADFRHRQHQANLLVTACVGCSFVLTVVGVATLASLAGHDPAAGEATGAKHSTSVAWRKPDDAGKLMLTVAAPDRSLKGEPLPARAPVPVMTPASAPEPILIRKGRELALAPLLNQPQAPYVLLRGLPSEARLSAGQRNPSGAWLVKTDDLGRLTLTMAGDAHGDYPLEIYALGDGALAQGRQRLIVRVEPEPSQQASDDMDWNAALSHMAFTTRAAANARVIADAAPLLTQAMRLLEEGDIAGARLMFQRAAETGNAKAGERLRTLASLSD